MLNLYFGTASSLFHKQEALFIINGNQYTKQ